MISILADKKLVRKYIKSLKSNSLSQDRLEQIHNELADISIKGVSDFTLDRVWDDCWNNQSGRYDYDEIVVHDIKFSRKILNMLTLKVISYDLLHRGERSRYE